MNVEALLNLQAPRLGGVGVAPVHHHHRSGSLRQPGVDVAGARLPMRLLDVAGLHPVRKGIVQLDSGVVVFVV